MNQPRNLRRAAGVPAGARSPFAFLLLILCCPLLLAPRLRAAERGPSTAEERAKVIDLTRKLENDPLNPQAEEWRVWLAKWIDEVPDVVVPVCPSLLPQLLRSNRN